MTPHLAGLDIWTDDLQPAKPAQQVSVQPFRPQMLCPAG